MVCSNAAAEVFWSRFCALSSVWWSSWLDFHNIKPTTHLGQIIDDRLT